MLTNPIRPEDSPFPICDVWETMAVAAWKHGASWVTLFGDDVTIESPNHYRYVGAGRAPVVQTHVASTPVLDF